MGEPEIVIDAGCTMTTLGYGYGRCPAGTIDGGAGTRVPAVKGGDMVMHRVWVGVLAALLLGGCGTDGSEDAAAGTQAAAEQTAAAGDEEAAIRAVVELWGAADTPEEMCAVLSEGLKVQFNAVEDCEAGLAAAIEDGRLHPEAGDMTISDVTVKLPLAVAEVDLGPPYVLLVKNLDEWRIDGQTDKEHLPQSHAVLLGDD